MVTNPAPRPPDEPSGHLDGDLVLDLTNELPSLSHVKVDLAVPAYVHPLVDPEVWDRLVDVARHLRFVVLNVDSGPGAVLDPAYPPVIERLRAARARTVGYVDTDYGRRDIEDVVAEARSWVLRYGVHGVFFDQVAGDFEHLEYYVACALGARANGAHFVVLNPGTDCHPGFADVGNVTVTFEGSWTEYRGYRPKRWTLSRPATRFCHLVYEVPADQLITGPARAAALHAGTALFTSGWGVNPWDRLPEPLVQAVERAHPGAAVAPAVGSPTWGARRYIAADQDVSGSGSSSPPRRAAPRRAARRRPLGRPRGASEPQPMLE